MHPALDVSAWEDVTPDPAVMVADGSNIKVIVRHGHLVVEDGVPGNRRERKIPRVPKTVTRLLILGEHGFVSLEAFRWLSETGIGVTHIARGESTVTSGPLDGDWRMVKAQTRKPVEVAQYLITQKLVRQADVLETLLHCPKVADSLRNMARGLSQERNATLDVIRGVEGLAAQRYWNAWAERVRIHWAPGDLMRVPSHWHSFPTRATLLTSWKSNRHATDPINAMLNYAYKVAETECIHACSAYGIHPDLGVMHAGGTDRRAFVLDLIEPVRPFCDELVLRYLATFGGSNYFPIRSVEEDGNGQCSLLPPLTHAIGNWAADILAAAVPHAEQVKAILKGAEE